LPEEVAAAVVKIVFSDVHGASPTRL
jgi:hypothetical protein